MANEIIIKQTNTPQEIKVRVTELAKGPQGPQGEPGRDGAIQYTAGTGITISADNEISATGSGAAVWGDITGTIANQSDLKTALAGKASASDLGNISNLTTTDKQSAVAAINEVDGHADSATSAAATNATAIQAIEDYLNLSVNNRYSGSQLTATSGSGTPDPTSFLYIARNAEGSLCKIYGTILITNAGTGTTTFKLNVDTGLRPTEVINIVGVGFANSVGTGSIANLNTKINTDGTIEFTCYHDSATYYMRNIACLIFVKDFGDTPE